MKRYLRDLVRRLCGPGGGSARPARTTRLEVEQLQDRVVPAIINLSANFNLPGAGTLHVTTELASGQFWGIFHDASSNINVPVSGQLTSLTPNTDKIVFGGFGANAFERETVSFVGEVTDYRPIAPELMTGMLTENYWINLPGLPPLHWAHTSPERAFGM
jgi:hypothetical protein